MVMYAVVKVRVKPENKGKLEAWLKMLKHKTYARTGGEAIVKALEEKEKGTV